MRGKNIIALVRSPKIVLAALLSLVILGAVVLPAQVRANDLPLAAGSPLTGVTFDDRPLLLPVQRNFQMAMLTASSQIGRSCGRMESYGWRTAQTEQHRVNLIFSNTVDRLRALGYAVEAQTPSSISKDITLYTADSSTKHFLFMWSAGEIGLVLVLCESSPPLTGHMAALYNASPAPVIPPPPQDVVKSKLDMPMSNKGRKLYDAEGFTPVGDWTGDYTCMRGYTGATMHIDNFKGEDFRGTFRFYSTAKNQYIPKGSYAIYGQYDRESKRILINPGNWIEHPNGYYKTIIIGSFDPETRSFSGFFQGILGCTSFEAKYDAKSHEVAAKKIGMKYAKPKKKKAPVKKAAVPKNPLTPDDVIAPIPDNIPPVTGDINLGTKATPPVPAALQPVAPAPSAPATTPAVTPAATMPPSPVIPETAPAAPVPTPLTVTPEAQPSPAIPPVSLPAAPEPPKPTSSLAPKPGPHAIVLAGDWPAAPSAPTLQRAPTYSTTVPQLAKASNYNGQPNKVPQTSTYQVEPPKLQQTTPYDTTPRLVDRVTNYNVNPPKLQNTSTYNNNAQEVQRTQSYDERLHELPQTPTYEIYKAPGS